MDFICLGSKITVNGDCSHEIKIHVLLGRKSVTNLDGILKSRDITLPTKVQIVKTMVSPVVMYRYDSWTISKAESQRIDAFKVWCWGRLLRDAWAARGSNQSILKEINPEYSLEGLMLILKLQYFVSLMWRTDSLEKYLDAERLKAGGKGNNREWDGWMTSLTQWTWVWARSRRWWRTGSPGVLQSMGSQRFVLSDWTIPVSSLYCYLHYDAFHLRVFSLHAYLLGTVLHLFFPLGALNPSGHVEDIRDMDSLTDSGRSLEEGMATHSIILAWRILQTEEPSRLQSIGLQRVALDWSDLAQ